jgi:hypothetical protein
MKENNGVAMKQSILIAKTEKCPFYEEKKFGRIDSWKKLTYMYLN